MTIAKELFLSILATDAYNRGYDSGIDNLSDDIDTAFGALKIIARSSSADDSQEVLNGFYAIAYEVTDGDAIEGFDTGDKIISYRGTDFPPENNESGSDIWNGWISGAGFPAGQTKLAFDFYKSVTNADAFDGEAQGITLTGHSLGGGLAGVVASISGDKAIIFDNMPYAHLATGCDAGAFVLC